MVTCAETSPYAHTGRRPTFQAGRYPGIQTQTHMRKTGLKTYYYHRASGTRIHAEPGTEEFDRQFEAARAKPRRPQKRAKWKPKKPRKSGVVRFVYFVQCVTLRHIKIGTSQHPWTRFINLKTACPDEVVLLGVIRERHSHPDSLEKRIHREFSEHHIRGEWFAENELLLQYIKAYAQPAEAVRLRYDFVDGKAQVIPCAA